MPARIDSLIRTLIRIQDGNCVVVDGEITRRRIDELMRSASSAGKVRALTLYQGLNGAHCPDWLTPPIKLFESTYMRTR